ILIEALFISRLRTMGTTGNGFLFIGLTGTECTQHTSFFKLPLEAFQRTVQRLAFFHIYNDHILLSLLSYENFGLQRYQNFMLFTNDYKYITWPLSHQVIHSSTPQAPS